MRLESALYSSSAGMNAHGVAIAAIGDNIANVNTTGFKAQRTEFANLVSDGLSGGTSSTVNGGGNGVQVARVRSIHEAGSIEDTGRSLDVSIEGDGFFVVGTTEVPLYTRAGNFSIDSSGQLAMPSGQKVLGFSVENGVPSTTLGVIDMLNFNANGSATTTLSMTGNLSSTSDITAAPAAPASFRELNAAANFITSTETVDSQGAAHVVSYAFFKTAANTFTVQAYVDGGDVGGTIGVPTLLGAGTMTFDETGVIPEANKAAAQLTLNPAYANGAAAGNITVDLSNFSQFARPSSIGSIVSNGIQPGSLVGYEIAKNGDVIATLDNGTRAVIASLGMASFNNVDGLQKVGDNLFQASDTTGDPNNGTAGTGARGTLRGESLERSTVDLGVEFPTLITIQRGYQANSKMISTVDGMIDQALSMLR